MKLWQGRILEFWYEYCQPVPLSVRLTNHSQQGSGSKNHTIPALGYL